MKRRIPDLDPPIRRRRQLTDAEKQLWEAETQGKIQEVMQEAKERRTPPTPAPRAIAPKSGSLPLGKNTLKTLDLHGHTQQEAHAMVVNFLEQAQRQGTGTIKIITGKGKGVLRTQLPRWLEETALRAYILSYAVAAPKHGGDGAWVVKIRRIKG